MTDLNIDLSEYSPVQSAGSINVPLPSAHLVMITQTELKQSEKDGITKGVNIVIDQEILASSCGNDQIGGTLIRYIPFNDFDEKALTVGRRTLSSLATTIGAIDRSQGRATLRSLNDLMNQPYIIVLDKAKDSNYPQYRKILNMQGEEVADVMGNFKPCELKDPALATELEKLLAIINNGNNANNQVQQQQPQGFAQPNNVPQQPNFGGQPTQPQNFMPQNQFGQAPQQVQPQQGFGFANNQVQQQQPQGFAQPNNVPQQPNFGGQPTQPQWTQTVNPQNGGQ